MMDLFCETFSYTSCCDALKYLFLYSKIKQPLHCPLPGFPISPLLVFISNKKEQLLEGIGFIFLLKKKLS